MSDVDEEAISDYLNERAIRKSASIPVPDQLFHYTSALGFQGIMQSHSVWLTYFGHMNDGSEIQYGLSLFDRIFIEEKNRLPHINGKLAGLRHLVRQNFINTPPYLFCLCEERNLVSQWREYGKDATSYAIGLDLRPEPKRTIKPRLILAKVEYSEKEHEDLIRRFVQACNEVAEHFVPPDVNLEKLDMVQRKMAAAAYLIICRCKHPAFASEQEWRLISIPQLGEPLQFRTTKMGVSPYLIAKADNTLPIRSVMIGPSAFREVAHGTTSKFTTQCGYPTINIHVSDIPLRSL